MTQSTWRSLCLSVSLRLGIGVLFASPWSQWPTLLEDKKTHNPLRPQRVVVWCVCFSVSHPVWLSNQGRFWLDWAVFWQPDPHFGKQNDRLVAPLLLFFSSPILSPLLSSVPTLPLPASLLLFLSSTECFPRPNVLQSPVFLPRIAGLCGWF